MVLSPAFDLPPITIGTVNHFAAFDLLASKYILFRQPGFFQFATQPCINQPFGAWQSLLVLGFEFRLDLIFKIAQKTVPQKNPPDLYQPPKKADWQQNGVEYEKHT